MRQHTLESAVERIQTLEAGLRGIRRLIDPAAIDGDESAALAVDTIDQLLPRSDLEIGELDVDGYPTAETLDAIMGWQGFDFHALMRFVRPIWRYANAGFWRQTNERYELATAGWSGNEDLIHAIRQAANGALWLMWWKESHRGGLFVFERLRVPRKGEVDGDERESTHGEDARREELPGVPGMRPAPGD